MIVISLVLFFLPAEGNREQKLLDWKDTKKLPWGILLLFGGGMALANMLAVNGVIDELAGVFENYASSPLFILLGVLVLIAIFGTEVMSNLALVSVFVPVPPSGAGGGAAHRSDRNCGRHRRCCRRPQRQWSGGRRWASTP